MKSGGKVAITISALGVVAAIIALNFTTGFQGWRDSTLAKMGGANDDCDASAVFDNYHALDARFSRLAPAAKVVDHQSNPSAHYGRVDLQVTIEREPAKVGSDSLIVSGLYGAKHSEVARNFIADDEETELQPGECATWRHTVSVTEELAGRYTYTLTGVWGERPYCFMVITYPEAESKGWADAHPSEPYCAVAEWENAWGEMESPPKQEASRIELHID